MEEETALQFYRRNQSMFLSDFFDAGNTGLTVSIERRGNVESGLWFTAKWLSYPDVPMEASAQTNKLMWERVMKEFLKDERERDELTKRGMEVVRGILDRKASE